MGLVLENSSSSSMVNRQHSTRKSLGKQEASPKRSSLLVDYSKRKASLKTNSSIKKDLFGDALSIPRRPVTDVLGDASAASCDIPDLDDSFSLDDVPPVSFRVRRSSIKRSKSMDERKISSYEHLQNSLRCDLLMQEEEEASEDSLTSLPEDRRASVPAPVDRRSQLANARRKHQSMRNLTTTPRRGLSSKSAHEQGGRRATLAKSKCTSCRGLLRRSRTLNESSLHDSIGQLQFGSSFDPTSSSRLSPKRSSTCGANMRLAGGRSSLALMKAQTMSRRNLLEAVETDIMARDNEMMDDSTIFLTGSRIRRLGAL